MLDCPVCAKPVDRETAPTSVYEGITYYFRCEGCKARFDGDPTRYLRLGVDPDHGRCGEQPTSMAIASSAHAVGRSAGALADVIVEPRCSGASWERAAYGDQRLQHPLDFERVAGFRLHQHP